MVAGGNYWLMGSSSLSLNVLASYYYYCVYFMPDSVPLMGPCRLLHILGQKKTLRRGEENPICVFHASRLLHACEQVSYKPLLNPVSKSAARSIASKGNFTTR